MDFISKSKNKIRSAAGFSLVELVVVSGMGLVLVLGLAGVIGDIFKSANLMEFNNKKEQLRSAIVGQILNNPENCRCLFEGANDFLETGTSLLIGANPTAIGRYNFTAPGNCATATMPMPLVSTLTGIEGILAKSIVLRDITNASGLYSGVFELIVSPTKQNIWGGTAIPPLRIPVNISTVPGAVAGMRKFTGCSLQSAGSGGPLDFSPSLTGDMLSPLRNGSSTWTLTKVPAGASGVQINYVMGHQGGGKGNRQNRVCDITNAAGQTYRVGAFSYGDAKQHEVSGAMWVGLGGSTNLSINCINQSNTGYMRITAVAQ